MKNILIVFICFQVLHTHAQLIWSADPNQSTNQNDFFRRFDSGNYPNDYCSTPGDEAGVTASSVSTSNDPTYGKVWQINKPINRKRGELARSEGSQNFYAPSEGDDIYVGWRWKIDTEDATEINDEVTVWQWKSAGTHHQNYPLNMEYDGDLTLNAWGPDYENNTSQSSMRTVLWRQAVPQDTWVTLVVRIKVDKDDFGGVVQFWFNGVQQELSNANFDKYQVNLSADKFTAYHRTNDGSEVYPKWGIYNKKSCAYNANAYFDAMKIGNSLNDVLPSGSIVNHPPTVTITSPANNATYLLGETIALAATASDPDGNLEKVNFKIDDNYYSNDRDEPYTGSFTPTEAGIYKIAARAFDTEDEQTETYVTITVEASNTAPSIAITSPQNNTVFTRGDHIILTADATDTDGAIDKVNFKLDGAYHSQDRTANGIQYSTTYDLDSPGFYELGARAFDEDGDATEVTITIEVKEEVITSTSAITNTSIQVFPNPSNTGLFHLNMMSHWEIYSLFGEQIDMGYGNLIDLRSQAKGIYFLKTETAGMTVFYE